VGRIAEAGASVAHCASIFSYYRAEQRDWYPLGALRDAGVSIGLGLADPGWFGTWDLFREASRARLLANYEYGAHQYHSRDLLRMLTIEGATALGLDDRIGSLEAGKRADYILLEVESATHQPLYNLSAGIVNTVTAGDVETVVVDGDVLVHGGRSGVSTRRRSLRLPAASSTDFSTRPAGRRRSAAFPHRRLPRGGGSPQS
jgi:5-methylthioadenosine/S-adenosylhomocysteine deaminase